MSDDVPGSFHPAIAGRERPMAELADTVRRLDRPGRDQHRSSRRARRGGVAAAERRPTCSPRTSRPQPVPRFIEPPEGPGAESTEHSGHASMDGSMPYDPVIGRFNPVALPVEISFEPPLAIGTAVFTTPYEGGPGWVHGAALAATFDIVLTAANHLSGAAGPDGVAHHPLPSSHARGDRGPLRGRGGRQRRPARHERGRLVQDGRGLRRGRGRVRRPRPEAASAPRPTRSAPVTARRHGRGSDGVA